MPTLNRSQLAKHFNVYKTTVDDWVALGIPGRKEGSRWVFDVEDCERWLADNRQGKTEEKVSNEEAKRRKDLADARLKELRYLRERGEVVPAEFAAEQVSRRLSDVRSALLALPKALAPECARETDPIRVEDLLRKSVYSSLRELADA